MRTGKIYNNMNGFAKRLCVLLLAVFCLSLISDAEIKSAASGKSDTSFEIESNDAAGEVFDGKKGIVIDNQDKLVTVDDKGHLVIIDKDNEVTVIDEESTYTLNENSDGNITITNSNGGTVKVADDGEVSVTGEKSEEKDENNGIFTWNPLFDFVIGIILIIIAFVVRKTKKTRRHVRKEN